MKCINHPDRDAVANCQTCGKGLCQECAEYIQPIPQCVPCFKNQLTEEKREIKKSLIKYFILGIIMGLLGLEWGSDVPLLTALFFFFVPFGWSVLNKITPNIFLFLPLIGWAIYFLVKLAIAMIIGMVACPYKIFISIKRMKELDTQLRSV